MQAPIITPFLKAKEDGFATHSKVVCSLQYPTVPCELCPSVFSDSTHFQAPVHFFPIHRSIPTVFFLGSGLESQLLPFTIFHPGSSSNPSTNTSADTHTWSCEIIMWQTDHNTQERLKTVRHCLHNLQLQKIINTFQTLICKMFPEMRISICPGRWSSVSRILTLNKMKLIILKINHWSTGMGGLIGMYGGHVRHRDMFAPRRDYFHHVALSSANRERLFKRYWF